MVRAGWQFLAILTGAAIAMPLAPVLAQGSPLAMLDRLDPGSWELRFRPDNRLERICVRDGRQLIQLRHQQLGCSHFVVEDTADRVTVQYSCKGRGYGRTYIRRESAGLAQIQSQGIVDGRPFAFTAEARLTGRCG